MVTRSVFRLEWVSLVYLGFFVMAVLAPSYVRHGYFGIDEVHIEESLIFVLGMAGMAIFSIYQRLMEKTEKEHESAKSEYERARRELVESYQYIGSVNRQIEILIKAANQTSQKIMAPDRSVKELLAQLASSASSSISAPVACIRYVDTQRLRTHHEIIHSTSDAPCSFKVSNKQLKQMHEARKGDAMLPTDDGRDMLVISSDHHGSPIQAFLLIPTERGMVSPSDISLLKVFANQAHMLHHVFSQAEDEAEQVSPLELVERAKKSVVGDVR